MDYFLELDGTINGEIQNEYCKTLERLELAALAKKAISFLH
jgi:histidinol phosphatase-like enzyme